MSPFLSWYTNRGPIDLTAAPNAASSSDVYGKFTVLLNSHRDTRDCVCVCVCVCACVRDSVCGV